MARVVVVACVVVGVARGFTAQVGRQARVLRASAIDTLGTAQEATVEKILSAIPELALKRDQSWLSEDGVRVGGAATRLAAYDAPGTPNVAWLSSLLVEGALSSLTIFNGPLTDCPHLASRVLVEGETMSVFLDWRPRAYGAYETIKPDGTYPGPEELGRAAFAYSGARASMDKFYTPELRATVDRLVTSLQGAAPGAALSDLEQLTRGPLCVDLVAPATEANVAAVVDARAAAADAWLQWQLDDQHAHKPGAPVNTQYVYDTKNRQNIYGALLAVYSAAFADDGVKLTAADSGPLDEAYVGGGS